jgi:poly(3-hydroxybutyrate) depolymerase
MLYDTYQLQDDLIAPFRLMAKYLQSTLTGANSGPAKGLHANIAAGMELFSRYEITHVRPEFGISSVRVGNADVTVTTETVLDLPFGRLLRFSKDIDTKQPRVLVLAPLSGHFATLLSGTIKTLLSDHEVFVTDWANARDVPLADGKFDMDDYVSYIIRFLETIGPRTHLLAVCQPCVQALTAVAIMSEDRHPATPLSMTLMAGPIDSRQSPTAVNKFALEKPIGWFRSSLISPVPKRFAGAGRRVYPGFIQLNAFIAMNTQRHQAAHRRLYDHLAAGEVLEANKIKAFYDEYFAVLDLTEEFFLETVERIFQKSELATGNATYLGSAVNPGSIRNTALLTIEGGRDDICALGQTAAAHDLCSALRPHLKRHHLQANVGHYGVFSGKRWANEIYPMVRNFILAVE